MGKKQFCFFQTAETGNRTPDSGVKGSGANHYPRAPAQQTVNQRAQVSLLQTERANVIIAFLFFFSAPGFRQASRFLLGTKKN